MTADCRESGDSGCFAVLKKNLANIPAMQYNQE